MNHRDRLGARMAADFGLKPSGSLSPTFLIDFGLKPTGGLDPKFSIPELLVDLLDLQDSLNL